MSPAEVPAPLLAGIGRCDITPEPGTPQGGWGAQSHELGVAADMPLLVTALALSDGASTCLLVEADAIGFDREATDRILAVIEQRTAIARDRIRFSCSHTHSGPNTFRLANISRNLDLIHAYLDELPRRIASAAWQAMQSLEPVNLAATTGTCHINRNRRVRSPQGETVVGVNELTATDPTLGVIRFERHDRTTLATLVHYACHPTTVGWQNDRFTPDFPGSARELVEQQLGGTCLFLQGAAGDLGPRRGFKGDLSIYRRLGRELGLAAASLALQIDPLHERASFASVMPSGANIAQYTYAPAPRAAPLCMITRTLDLPIRELSPEDELAVAIAQQRAAVTRHRENGSTQEMRLAQARATQLGWKLENSRRYAGHASAAWPIQVLRVGSIVFVSMAGEPFSSIARRIRERSPAEFTFVSGYSNGGFGYIPDRAAYAEGGYEIEATPFAAGADDVVVQGALDMIHEVFQEKNAK